MSTNAHAICSVCGHRAAKAFDATVLHRHRVSYFYCEHCGLLRSEQPYWLEEAYASAIADLDTGIVARNIRMARRLSTLLYFGFGQRRSDRWLDFAGGTGMLTRLMRDRGFDFRWHDRYADNLFARGFEHRSGEGYVGVTAIEAIEHFPDPLDFLRRLFEDFNPEIVVFSTVLFEEPVPGPDWWYYAFDAGQHIAFFQRRTLEALAAALGTRVYTSSRGLHCMTRRSCSDLKLAALVGPLSFLASPLVGLKSRTMSDHELLAGRSGVADR